MVLSSNNNHKQKTCGPSVCNINGSGGGGHNNLNSYVIELTNKNEFNEKVLKSNNIWMVNFYAPWCGWCQRLAPEWEKAAKMLKDTNVNIGSVDCTVQEKIAKSNQIRGYPTIKIFYKGSVKNYNYKRNAEDIANFALTLEKNKSSSENSKNLLLEEAKELEAEDKKEFAINKEEVKENMIIVEKENNDQNIEIDDQNKVGGGGGGNVTKVEVEMHCEWSEDSISFELAEKFCTFVKLLSGEKLIINLKSDPKNASQFGELVNNNEIKIAHWNPANYHYEEHPSFALFGPTPSTLGMTNQQLYVYMNNDDGNDLYNELMKEMKWNNIVNFYSTYLGPDPFGWFKNPINRSTNNLKFQCYGLSKKIIENTNMVNTNFNKSEVKTKIKTNEVDGVQFSNLIDSERSGIQNDAKYCYVNANLQQADCFKISINKNWFNNLPSGFKEIIKTASYASTEENRILLLNEYSNTYDRLEKNGVKFLLTPQPILDQQQDAHEKLIEDISRKDRLFNKIYKSQVKFMKFIHPYELAKFEGNYEALENDNMLN